MIRTQNYIQSREPLLPSIAPLRPWAVIGSDLFQFQGNNYMVIVDYFSNRIECVRMNKATVESGLSDIARDRRKHFGYGEYQ